MENCRQDWFLEGNLLRKFISANFLNFFLPPDRRWHLTRMKERTFRLPIRILCLSNGDAIYLFAFFSLIHKGNRFFVHLCKTSFSSFTSSAFAFAFEKKNAKFTFQLWEAKGMRPRSTLPLYLKRFGQRVDKCLFNFTFLANKISPPFKGHPGRLSEWECERVMGQVKEF